MVSVNLEIPQYAIGRSLLSPVQPSEKALAGGPQPLLYPDFNGDFPGDRSVPPISLGEKSPERVSRSIEGCNEGLA